MPDFDPDSAPSDSPVDPATNDAAESIIPPEQAPMDDAAGGHQAEDSNVPIDDEVGDTPTDDLTVQGGE